MRILVVGDPHVVASEVKEARALMKLIADTAARTEGLACIVIMGDLHHNHRVIDVDVLGFWRDQLWALSREWNVVCLVGNHDRSGDANNSNHALLAYNTFVNVIERPQKYVPGLGLMPYMPTPEAFEAGMKGLLAVDPCPVVLCHQTFNGARFENGFFVGDHDPSAVDPSKWPEVKFISGHIHTPQRFGNVTYVGAPRWRSLADANTRRGIAVFEISALGAEIVEIVDTDTVCSPLYHVVLDEDTQFQEPVVRWQEGGRFIVDIIGSAAFIKATVPEWEARGARIRTFPKREYTAAVRESQGISVALREYVDSFTPIYGTSLDELRTLCKQRLEGLA